MTVSEANGFDAIPEVEDPYIPAHDSEALLLSAMMWTRDTPALQSITSQLTPEDFYRPHYGYIFSVVRQRVTEGKPCDAASMNSALNAAGGHGGWTRKDIVNFMAMLATLESNSHIVNEYAVQVASGSYRRQFKRMVQHLHHAGDEAAEYELFDIMVQQGKAQRTAWERYQSLQF